MTIEKTAGAVVYRKRAGQIEYLLLQSTNPGHFWGFPKGHVEGTETLATTARREIKEETGLTVPLDTNFSLATDYDLPNGNHKEMTLFLADLTLNPALTLQQEEIMNAVWLPYHEARERLTYANLKGLLDQVNAHLTGAAQ